MSQEADALHTHIANAFGVPQHLKDALSAWVHSVEDRLSPPNDDPQATAEAMGDGAAFKADEAADAQAADEAAMAPVPRDAQSA